jgi:hypothetical protein
MHGKQKFYQGVDRIVQMDISQGTFSIYEDEKANARMNHYNAKLDPGV